MKLSSNQQYALRELHNNPDGVRYGWGSGCTNPTMSALQRRGFVQCEFDRSKSAQGFPWSRWLITPEGEQYLKENVQ